MAGGPLDKDARLAFISHSHVDRTVAAELKGLLRPLGLNGFVAHEDIEPNAEWQDEILRNLRDCRCLVAIATEDARTSSWVNQEIGAAVVRGIGTVAVNCGAAPFGFLYRFQAARWTPRATPVTVEANQDRAFLEANIPGICHALQRAGVLTREHLIEGLGDAWTFEEARVVARLIAESGTLEGPQAVRLVEVAAKNPSVSGCWEAQRLLPPLISPHYHLLDPTMIHRFEHSRFAIPPPPRAIETFAPAGEP